MSIDNNKPAKKIVSFGEYFANAKDLTEKPSPEDAAAEAEEVKDKIKRRKRQKKIKR